MKADAIVNTANPEPVIGAGTDYAIHQAAGPELLEERKKIGSIPLGHSVETPAFQLKAKYVLHTVGPRWIDGKHQEEEYLRQAYDSALYLAERLGCESIAFPLMAAGSYAFPHERALAIAIAAFTDFLMEHEMRIDLVLYDAKAFGIVGSVFDDLKSYIDDNYVDEHRKLFRPSSANRPGRKESFLGNNMPRPKEADEDEAEITESWNDDLSVPENIDGFSDAISYSISMPMAETGAAAADLEDFLRQSDKTFSEYLLDLLKERDGKDSEVYKRAEVSKQLFSKILNNKDYQPTKNTVLQLAIGLQLDLEQTKKLLEKAGYSLTRSSKADLVVQYYIEREVYSVTFINEALYDCGLPLLKTGLKH